MFSRRFWIIIGLLLLLFTRSSFASVFTVRHIQVQGNRRVSSSAVLSYVPVHVGQSFNTRKSAGILRSLYKSGYFSNIQLLRRGNTLVIRVRELPIISKFIITGNKAIPSKRLKPGLKKLNLQIGDVFHPQHLKELKMGLIQAYKNQGRYSVVIDSKVTKRPYNTVAVDITIKEGKIAAVETLRFVGNHAFSGHTLREQFKLTTPGLFTFITHTDRYSPFQLDKDLQNLQYFYYNHGYLEFKVLKKKVDISPDHRRVDITIRVYEGPVYHISGYKISGKYASDPKIQKLVTLKTGAVFSRKKVVAMDKNLSNYFANEGYAFPKVNVVPKLNRAQRLVFLTVSIKPGKRVYVHQIHIAGNQRTKDMVARNQMRQMEGSVYSLGKINESERRLRNLPYFKDVTATPVPVPGKPDQVDLNYHLTEVNAGRASVQGGYSDIDGFLYGASVSEPNFMGTGKLVSLGFQRSAYSSQYSFGYNNPFYTTYGLSRGFNVYYTHTTPGDVNLDTYTMDTYGASMNYSMPISEFNYLSFGYGYSHVNISNINPAMISPSAFQFSLLHPSPYNQFTGTLGVTHSHLDRAIFPTNGSLVQLGATLGVPILDSSLAYYITTFSWKSYFPLGHGFIIHPHALLGYGNGYGNVKSLPFFNNFFGGGIETLPGYEPNTLGPQNPNDIGAANGGNVELFGGLNFIFPNGLTDKLRTSLFVDFGNIFQTHKTAGNPGSPGTGPVLYEDVALKNIRGSAGLMVSWFSPIGIITVGYGVPFNVKGARTQQFGFTFGGSI